MGFQPEKQDIDCEVFSILAPLVRVLGNDYKWAKNVNNIMLKKKTTAKGNSVSIPGCPHKSEFAEIVAIIERSQRNLTDPFENVDDAMKSFVGGINGRQ